MPIVILGTDAMLAALPATPVQLAHACLRAGFANVIPASWGDELIATAILRRLAPHGGPAIQCSCPRVAHRLLTVGGDLRPVMVPLVSPPVAAARYVRAVSQPTRTRITYVGACPGAIDDAIDIRMTPDALLAMLAEREIIPEAEPRVFESVIPPDRRRFRSQPGGVPTADALWGELGARTLVEIEGDDIASEIAHHLLSGKTVLIDASTRLGCVCAGAVGGVAATEARAHVVEHEPPRAATPVVNDGVDIDVDLAVPAAPRTPVDVVAWVEPPGHAPAAGPRPLDQQTLAPMPGHTPVPTPPHSPVHTPPHSPSYPPGHASSHGPRISPTPGVPTVADPRHGRSTAVSTPPRPVLGSVPVARVVEGRTLPRAYIARRRSSPRSVEVVPPTIEPPRPEPPRSEPPRPEPERQAPTVIEPPVIVPPATVAAEPAPAAEIAPPTPAPEITPTPAAEVASSTPAPVRKPRIMIPEPSAPASAPAGPTSPRSPWLIILLLIAVIASAAVGVIIGRSLGVGSTTAPSSR